MSDPFIESEERLFAAVKSLEQAIGNLKDAPKRMAGLTAEKEVLEKGFEKLKGDYETLEAAFQELKKKFEQLAETRSGDGDEDFNAFKAELKARVDKTIACLEQALG